MNKLVLKGLGFSGVSFSLWLSSTAPGQPGLGQDCSRIHGTISGQRTCFRQCGAFWEGPLKHYFCCSLFPAAGGKIEKRALPHKSRSRSET